MLAVYNQVNHENSNILYKRQFRSLLKKAKQEFLNKKIEICTCIDDIFFYYTKTMQYYKVLSLYFNWLKAMSI
ncbi:hypothetical protein RBEAN4_1636 [Rickettsia bellii str. RML An4]|uniref:Uncharacterized protein n=1 Tax=Rickettsia bellii str. RML An4 TaxID=1359193 RepID=A0A0F3QDN0_RICBE|nr:hypothetical protein RBEAN4_1636 [Rickettsia bellii str. RML An4]